ncbi:DEAD/DEAH box RNA helicase [Achlya hypogyna]|uniref:DEAD/DEAH box RNA helicase n=1 Tax=Achlya hypogyna TaxID=1202772 RepID=A0A1V9YY82_ACHHY|nr:DEAD/DEAH box RNA helicase [Achlya hypogyna]
MRGDSKRSVLDARFHSYGAIAERRANAALQMLQEASSSGSCWQDIGSKDGIVLSKTAADWKVFVANKAVTSIETKLPTVVKRLFQNDYTVACHTFTQEIFQETFVDAAVIANIPPDTSATNDVPTSGTSAFHPVHKRVAVKWYATAGKSKLHKPLDHQVLEFIGLVVEHGRLKSCYLFQESIPDSADFRPPADSAHFERMQIDALIMKFERGARLNGSENVLMSVALQRMPSLLDLGFKNPAQDMVFKLAKGFRDALQTVKSVTLDMNFVQTASWVPDSDRPFCCICDRPFISFFRRRHHCRVCGEVVCDQCSNILPASSQHSIPDRHNVQTVYIQADIRLCCRCLLERQGQMNQTGDLDIDEADLFAWLDPDGDADLTASQLYSPRSTISQARFADTAAHRISEGSEGSSRRSSGLDLSSVPSQRSQRSPVATPREDVPPSPASDPPVPRPQTPRVRAVSWGRRDEARPTRLYEDDGRKAAQRSHSDRAADYRPPLSIDRKYLALDSPPTPPRRRTASVEASPVRVASAWAVQTPNHDAIDVAFHELVGKLRGGVSFLVVSFSEGCDGQYILHRLHQLAPGVPFIGGTIGRGVCDETAWVSVKRDALVALWGVHDPEGSYAVSYCEYKEGSARAKAFKATQAALGYAQNALPVASTQVPDFCMVYASPIAIDDALTGVRAAVGCPVLGGCSGVSENRERLLQIGSCSGGFRRNGGRMGGTGSHVGAAIALCYPSVETVVDWFSGYAPLVGDDGRVCSGMVTAADPEQQHIYAIDDRPAAHTYKAWLRVASEKCLGDFLSLRFPRLGYIHPFGCLTDTDDVRATPVIVGMDDATGAVSTTTPIAEGEFVALMEASPDILHDSVASMGTRVQEHRKFALRDVAGTLLFLSTGMQVVLGSQSMAGMVGAYKEWAGNASLLGLTAFGEIGHLPSELRAVPHCDSLMFSALVFSNRRKKLY